MIASIPSTSGTGTPDALSGLLTVAGQSLLDAPNQGWPSHEAWLQPTDRLAARYELGSLLPLDSVSRLPVSQVLKRLDPAPGVDKLSKQSVEAARQILATPEYQVG